MLTGRNDTLNVSEDRVAQSVQIKSLRAWHEELMDFMLAMPRAGLKETSDYFGVSMSWISIVKNSDAFQNEWEKRRAEHSSAVSVSIVERVEALAEVALETMTEKLEREGASVGLTTLREISETALKSLGFGNRNDVRAGAGAQIGVQNNNMIVVDRETLARAREARIRMQEHNMPSLESPEDVVTVSPPKLQPSLEAPEPSPSGPVENSDSESDASESEGRGEITLPLGRDGEPLRPDSIPEIRTKKESDRIFKELFGGDNNKGD